MGSHSVPTPVDILYERDFIAWTEQMANLLRSRDAAGLDWEHLAEEIRDLGISLKSSLRSHMEILLMHLIKREIQADRRTRSWETSISNSRIRVNTLLESFPSLRPYLRQNFQRCYDKAYRLAITEAHLPENTPYTRWDVEKVLDPAFLPD